MQICNSDLLDDCLMTVLIYIYVASVER